MWSRAIERILACREPAPELYHDDPWPLKCMEARMEVKLPPRTFVGSYARYDAAEEALKLARRILAEQPGNARHMTAHAEFEAALDRAFGALLAMTQEHTP